jgi:hypothetical protein
MGTFYLLLTGGARRLDRPRSIIGTIMNTPAVPGRGAVDLLRELSRQGGPSAEFWQLFWNTMDGLSRRELDAVLTAVGRAHLQRRLEMRVN